jgi:predicted MFS family arabinose efflux permease
VSALALACAVAFAVLLPRSSFFTPSAPRLRVLLATLGRNLADTGLLRLYLIGFALMGAFVTVYNYLTFRLSGAPFGLSTSVIGALFTVYLAGTWSSAQAGRLADRAGRYVVLAAGVAVAIAGVALTLPDSLASVVTGLVVLTAGFFAAHSVARRRRCTCACTTSAAASPARPAASSTPAAAGRSPPRSPPCCSPSRWRAPFRSGGDEDLARSSRRTHRPLLPAK